MRVNGAWAERCTDKPGQSAGRERSWRPRSETESWQGVRDALVGLDGTWAGGPLGCSSPPTSWPTERVVRRCKTGKCRFFPPQPESSPLSSAFAQVGNCRPFAFPYFRQRTTRSVDHELGGLLQTNHSSSHSTTSGAEANRISAKPGRQRQANGIPRQKERRYLPALIS